MFAKISNLLCDCENCESLFKLYYKAVSAPQLRPLHICSQVPGWALTRASQLFPIKIHGHGSKIVIQVGSS